MRKRSKQHNNNILKIEALSILLSAAGFYLTHDPTWFALLLAILVLALTWHSLMARWSGRRTGSRRTAAARTASRQKQSPRAGTPKRLPPLKISSATPLQHPAKYDSSCSPMHVTVAGKQRSSRNQASRAQVRTRKAPVALAAA